MPPVRRPRLLLAGFLVLALLAAACGDDGTAGPGPESTTSTVAPTTADPPSTPPPSSPSTPSSTPEPPRPTVPVPVHVDENGFDDHTVPVVASVDEWFALARTKGDRSVTKFTISSFGTPAATARWADSNFFELHDEWFYYRLLNGQPVPGTSERPVSGLGFDSIAAIYAWATGTDDLPDFLDWVDSQSLGRDRLASRRFYDLVYRTTPRVFGAGSVVHVPDSPDGERWLMELEFGDAPTAAEISHYVDVLTATLPAAIGDELEWVIRSPQQDEVAIEMAETGHPLADRITRWRDVVPPGELDVYNPGIAAGRLLLVDDTGSQLARAADTDILVMEYVPDYLPPASALITSAPQTPLAHVNLLARNRGIPNLSLSGVTDDPSIESAARVRAYAIVRADGDDLDIALITEAEFEAWQDRTEHAPVRVPAVDVDAMALTVDLDDLAAAITSDAALDEWRPTIGGKSAGFVALLRTPEVTAPPTPLAITVRPYVEHLALVEDALDAVLRDDDFAADPRARYLFLEGPGDYEDFYTAPRDLDYGAALQAEHPPGTLLGDVLAADGFTKYFRDRPMDPATLRELTATLEDRFGAYDDRQGLRFRSSSSVEDIEGFNGAGLYDSNTGFLAPEAQPDPDDHEKSIEYTIKKTWASYWGFEAFEERRRENVDHRSGAMGITVHARFDDSLEENNGVATFTFAPPGAGGRLGTATINVQAGAVSVANPDAATAELPEVIEVIVPTAGPYRIERVASSSIVAGEVLGDDAVVELVDQLAAASETWRAQVNAGLPAAQRVDVVTLDFEFKTMAPGWPAGAADDSGGLIVKQARSLDPGLRGVPDSVLDLPIPRDVLARASRVARLTCGADTVIAVWTDPLAAPDMGFADTPFTSPSTTDLAGCTSSTLHSTADRFLLDLLAEGDRLDIAG